jgi:predicted N-acyltransferase
MDHSVAVSVFSAFSDISESDWDSCACPEASDGNRPFDPFTTHRFLSALEVSGSIGGTTGWEPLPLVAKSQGAPIAVAPLFVKRHSQGEYIFDHGWAEALNRAGGQYYPKLQVSVPFTPVTGRRLLARAPFENDGQKALLEMIKQLTNSAGISSAHITFCTEAEEISGEEAGYMPRFSMQYHWHNDGYASYDDFLGQLSSRKRKALRRERAQAQGFGGSIRVFTGQEITSAHLEAFWAFYQDTGARKWGRPYLTKSFFQHSALTLREDMLLVMAERDGKWVAGAMNFIGREALFGRYWGAIENHPSLHFELCYHQAVDWAIANGMARVEAGAQGDHKLARGYQPVITRSVHWIADPGFRAAVARYLHSERNNMKEHINELAGFTPFRREPPQAG